MNRYDLSFKGNKPEYEWIRRGIFFLCVLLCFFPFVSPPVSLFAGIVFAQIFTHPCANLAAKSTGVLLKMSVVGLGFGMNIFSAVSAGKEGILFTIASIFSVLTIGFLIGRLFKLAPATSLLISAGTAICGGSAIAALAPVIRAGEKQISVALGTVFILNSLALFIFPGIGHGLHLTQSQFGMWCAIAIHDTSSVVGAAAKYGEQALQIATTVKLARALWIIPVAFGATFFFKNEQTKVKIPYFIGLFILAVVANTYVPWLKPLAPHIVHVSKIGLTVTLFLIGSGLSFTALKGVGIKPLLQGIILWILISVAALWAVIHWI